MPELPEIETIKRGLTDKVVGKPVLKVVVNNAGVVRNTKAVFVKLLTDARFLEVRRRGKMLVLPFLGVQGGQKRYLLIRLGMTGRLVYFGREDGLWGGKSFEDKKSYSHRHCHVILELAGDSDLLFCDIRKFGYMEIVDEKKLGLRLESFGPEPLDAGFTLPVLRRIIQGKKTNIKALLLDQKRIAGIGNIYADEILFDAGVMPTRRVDSLEDAEVSRIYRAIGKILQKAVKNRGTTFSDYVDASGNGGGFQKYLRVYGRKGERCFACAGKVEKMRLNGRGTHFCPKCQK